jgi:hypothetical protein
MRRAVLNDTSSKQFGEWSPGDPVWCCEVALSSAGAASQDVALFLLSAAGDRYFWL